MRIFQLLTFVLLLSMPCPLSANTIYLFGKVGNFPVGASLEQDNEKVTGWYFYHSQAKMIRLEGRLDSGGKFHIEETADNKTTGIFEGNKKNSCWTGTWRKTAASDPLQFYLDENRKQTKNLTCTCDCLAKERVAEFGYTYRWKLKVIISDGIVKDFHAVQGAYWDTGGEQTCNIDLRDLKQDMSDAGILLRTRDASCRVRIIGDADTLWIVFGEISENGKDCRQAGDTMFCGPRAFWNDILFDRHTQKCKAIK